MEKRTITIQAIEHKKNDYIAYFKSDFLQATFSVCFKDNIVGAVALNNFADMIKKKFSGDDIDFYILDEKLSFRSKALLDTLTGV